jgi:glutathione synthase/RimK-type ligase-like ATP-grasp enzyme
VILVWGIAADTTTARVLGQLARRHADVVFLDQHTLLGPALLSTDVELDVADGVRATLSGPDRRVDLREVHAAFLRPYDPRAFALPRAAGAGSRTWTHAVTLDDLLWTWADVTPARVVNPPGAMAPNGSKPFQARQIAAAGFAVPETLVTTDAAAAEEFWRRHGQVVYKSLSGNRSVVCRVRPPDLARWRDLGTCPVQFQRYVPGVDHRVHVVGDEVFCARVESDADDYRYAARQGGSTLVCPAVLPPEVARRCRALGAAQGLAVAGIDLRRTPEGEWFCFEVNPSPAFSVFDSDDERIAGAVAALLLSPGVRVPAVTESQG